MKLFRKRKKRRQSLMVVAMLDIVSNAMAGIAVLFFIHVALQLQEPPPVPVRGRLVLELEQLAQLPGTQPPVIFLKHLNKHNRKANFDAFDQDIDLLKKSNFTYSEDPAAQIGFERVVMRAVG